MIKVSIAFILFLSMLSGGSVKASADEVILTPPKKLAIYYGYPSFVNGSSGDVKKAEAYYKNFDTIIFGDGVEHPTHDDHQKSIQIIAYLNLTGTQKIFGYIDLGVTHGTNNFTMDKLKHFVDEWKSTGVQGVFLDDFGYDFGVARARQTEIVDYVHAKGMFVTANAWRVDEALGDLDEKGAQSLSHLTKGDFYLAESWLYSGKYVSFSDWQTKAVKCFAYQKSKGVQTLVVSTVLHGTTKISDAETDAYKQAWFAAAVYGFQFQWTDNWFSASDAVLIDYESPTVKIGKITSEQPNVINNTKTELTTNTGKIIIEGDGSTWGKGYFLENPDKTVKGNKKRNK